MEKRAEILGDERYVANSQHDLWINSYNGGPVFISWCRSNTEMNPDGTPWPSSRRRRAGWKAWCAAANGGGQGRWTGGPEQGPLPGHVRHSAAIRVCSTPTNKERYFGLSDALWRSSLRGQYVGDAEKIKVRARASFCPTAPGRPWRPTASSCSGIPTRRRRFPAPHMPIAFRPQRRLHGLSQAARECRQLFGLYRRPRPPLRQGDGNRRPERGGATDSRPSWWAAGPTACRLMAAPTYQAWQAVNASWPPPRTAQPTRRPWRPCRALEYVNFTFRSDPLGVACPVFTRTKAPREHARPAGPANLYIPQSQGLGWLGAQQPAAMASCAEVLPYGSPDPSQLARRRIEQGIIFLAVRSSLFRQFGFVQAAMGAVRALDFNTGSDTCPIVGEPRPSCGLQVRAQRRRRRRSLLYAIACPSSCELPVATTSSRPA